MSEQRWTLWRYGPYGSWQTGNPSTRSMAEIVEVMPVSEPRKVRTRPRGDRSTTF